MPKASKHDGVNMKAFNGGLINIVWNREKEGPNKIKKNKIYKRYFLLVKIITNGHNT